MIFREDLAIMVYRGEKTQTRRKVERGDMPAVMGGVIWSVLGKEPQGNIKYAVNMEIDVAANNKEPICKATIKSIRRERVRDISEADAKAEGCNDAAEFHQLWRELYGEDADLGVEVWAIGFKVVR